MALSSRFRQAAARINGRPVGAFSTRELITAIKQHESRIAIKKAFLDTHPLREGDKYGELMKKDLCCLELALGVLQAELKRREP